MVVRVQNYLYLKHSNMSRYFHILQSSSIGSTCCENELNFFQKSMAIKVLDLTPVNKKKCLYKKPRSHFLIS